MFFVTELIIGAILGLIISLTGVGGGVVVLPVLTYFFGLDALSAVATANFLSMLMKISSSYMHFRLGNVPIKSAVVVLAIMIPATVLTSFLVSYFNQWPGYQPQVELAINILIVVAIIYSLFLFIYRIFFAFSLNQFEENNTIDIRSLLLPAISAGVVLGATGVGDGVVVLPLLLRYLKLSVKQAIGTAIFVTTILSGSSAIAYMRDGHTHIVLAFTLCIGSLMTIPLAKYLMLNLSDRVLQYLTLLFILSSAIMMSIKLWHYF
ncbi:sulfite exporter TauE/SafE family protein [Arsenophonus nasoniae]|uniref:sulfite exporter TauE/SafE family protein n=1 Tax=Arsenophonus nasoniae TaxID=638 RepID=UPI00387A0087